MPDTVLPCWRFLTTAELVATVREVPKELWVILREASRPAPTVLVKIPVRIRVLAAIAPFTKYYPIPGWGTQYCGARTPVHGYHIEAINSFVVGLTIR